MKRATERKWHSWLNGVAQTTCPSMWRRQRRLWWTSGETPLTTPHWPSTARLWRESAALNSWGCTSQRTSPGLPTPSLSPRRHNSAYTYFAGWKEQASLHPSSPPSTGVPLRACWPAASLSGTETVVQQTARPSSGQWTPLQKSLVPLSPPSWIFSLHDAPAKQKVSWRTPPTPPTVSSSSYPQVDGTGVSEPAPPDCSTASSPRLWEPWTHITHRPSLKPQTTPHSACTRHFHTPLCVHNPTKDWLKYTTVNVYWLMHHKSPYTVPQPAAWMSLFLHMYSIWSHLHSCTVCIFFCLCIGNHFYI